MKKNERRGREGREVGREEGERGEKEGRAHLENIRFRG